MADFISASPNQQGVASRTSAPLGTPSERSYLHDEIKRNLEHSHSFFKAAVVPFLRPLSRSEM